MGAEHTAVQLGRGTCKPRTGQKDGQSLPVSARNGRPVRHRLAHCRLCARHPACGKSRTVTGACWTGVAVLNPAGGSAGPDAVYPARLTVAVVAVLDPGPAV